MRSGRTFVLAIALAVGGCDCGGDDAPPTRDAGPGDGGVTDAGGVDSGSDAGPDAGDVDAGTDAGVDAGPDSVRETVFQTSGGGRASSSGYRLRLSVGAPQPMGRSSGGSHRATTGPSAAGR